MIAFVCVTFGPVYLILYLELHLRTDYLYILRKAITLDTVHYHK